MNQKKQNRVGVTSTNAATTEKERTAHFSISSLARQAALRHAIFAIRHRYGPTAIRIGAREVAS